jgi:hypothetical protein
MNTIKCNLFCQHVVLYDCETASRALKEKDGQNNLV